MSESAAAVQKRVQEQRGLAAQANVRPVHHFTIPARFVDNTGIEKIGMVQLTSDEELRATKRARNDSMRLAYELAKQALVEVNGKPVEEGDGSQDSVWNSMSPKIRMLVVTAYGELHTPEQDDIDTFLKSQKVAVG